MSFGSSGQIALDLYLFFKPLLFIRTRISPLPSNYAAVWSKVVALSSSSLDLSIDTILEPLIGMLREHEVVAVFAIFEISGR
ncbi:hypothetical protein F511_46979 [Dorcoceras hygrometricum]|uniref:Uncharacterized protein n=1 Tax=Dorcoceras hygrometricum TaxID=472368 RepID=A0A2Z6ZS84_9LAMI|nr:hypothetical protein F511_46979 [Dorcoceras hygrometricum]